jgi:hypothetical protein
MAITGQCQKAHGVPFRTRARVVAADFRFLVGEELVLAYQSTPGTHRGFCRVCSAPVLLKFDDQGAAVHGHQQSALYPAHIPGQNAPHNS